MTTYDNPLIDSGEYTRLYAVEVPIGARLIGMRDNDVIVTGVKRYTSTIAKVERVTLTLDDGRIDDRMAAATVLVRNHTWRTITWTQRGEPVSAMQCEDCGRMNLAEADRTALCSRLEMAP
jgi:hypothetical protein